MKTFKQFREETVVVNELFGLGKPKPKPKKSLARKVVGGAAKLAGKAVKKVGSAVVKGAAGAVGGAVKGIASGLRDHYEVGEEVVTELNRYGKETGKATGSLNKRPGTPVKSGGTSSPVMRAVRTSIRKETGKPEGQQRRGHDERHSGQNRPESPASTVSKRRASKAAADASMRDTRGT